MIGEVRTDQRPVFAVNALHVAATSVFCPKGITRWDKRENHAWRPCSTCVLGRWRGCSLLKSFVWLQGGSCGQRVAKRVLGGENVTINHAR